MPQARTQRRYLKSSAARGLTLIELMLGIAIVAVLATAALGGYQDYRQRARVSIAVTDIAGMSAAVERYIDDNHAPPDSLAQVGYGSKLDPWGHAYYYVNLTTVTGHGQSRKDKNLNPLNSDFDLYSAGKDGKTQTSLMAPVSRDDVIRARDGKFIGLASDFDP